MSEKIVGLVEEEDSTFVTAWNSPYFHVKMTTRCIQYPDSDCERTYAATDIEIGLSERTDCSIYSSLKALYVEAESDEDWEAIKEIGRKIVEVAEKSQAHVKEILGEDYNREK